MVARRVEVDPPLNRWRRELDGFSSGFEVEASFESSFDDDSRNVMLRRFVFGLVACLEGSVIVTVVEDWEGKGGGLMVVGSLGE